MFCLLYVKLYLTVNRKITILSTKITLYNNKYSVTTYFMR